ncbi:MAG: hypothetical protein ACJ8DI_00300 [Ktedonobacteraceae bacterium]
MRYFKIVLFLAAIFAILATLFIRAEGSYAAALASCGAWRIVKSPNSSFGVESLFNGVAVVSSNDAWAVGTSRNQSGFSSHTLTEHWNGSQWSIISSANPSSAQNVLVSAAALTTNNVWSVGETGNSDGTAFQTLVEHWNGTRWNVIPSLNTSLSFNYLSSVAIVSAKDIWAVGVAMAAGDVSSQTLIEHWNGSQWSIVASPNPGSPFNNLRSVTAVSATNVWAVGQYDTSSGFHTLVEHWNGSQWKVVASPNPPSREGTLNGVDALTANNIWAVGFTTDMNGFSQTLAEHWNGTTWQLVASPNPDPMINGLSSLSAASANNIWAVGIQNVASKTLIQHWNGTQWQVVASPNRDGSSNILQSDAVVPNTSKVWAVGYSGNSTLTEFYC